jgi:hypothetical protein
MSEKHYELFNRTVLNHNEMEILSATLLWHYTYDAVAVFPVSCNFGFMDNPPPPPQRTINMLVSMYNIFIAGDVISDIMADETGDIRHKYT